MSCPLIGALVTEGWEAPGTGERITMPVARVEIEKGLGALAAELVRALPFGRKYLLVSDAITYEVMGRQVERGLRSLGKVVLLTFPLGVKATKHYADYIMEAAVSVDVIVAVGSGTINDLCKYASFQSRKPYIVFATAPSMNGYCSANASITIDGYKQTVPCHLPYAVFFDLDVMCNAPKRLIRSGLGDSLCRSTAQADWLLSHILLKTPYTAIPYQWLAMYENRLFSESRALVEGDSDVMRLLCYTLVLSGFGMVLAGGSYPASQGEHIIAHTMEMASKSGEETQAYHGEQIAVTTLTMAVLQQRMVERKPVLREHMFPRREMAAFLGRELAKECEENIASKYISRRKITGINEYIEFCWGQIAERLAAVMVDQSRLSRILQAAGAMQYSWQLGWSEERYARAVRYGSCTRDRFTFLDLDRLSSDIS